MSKMMVNNVKALCYISKLMPHNVSKLLKCDSQYEENATSVKNDGKQ